MARSSFPFILAVLVFFSSVHAESQLTSQNIERLDPNFASQDPAKNLRWYDILQLGLEGKGWENTAHPYDRLPGKAEGVVRDAVWSLSHHSAGMCARFVTDASEISARWTLRYDNLAMDHMPATGVSGLDLYVRDGEVWRWVAVGRPKSVPTNETTLVSGMPSGLHEFLLYLPLYNGVESVELGVRSEATLAKAPPRIGENSLPICFYGTSITHGGCASRPGMAYPAIVGRHLDRPAFNLGFSGNGKMDIELADLLAELEVCLYVLDCAPNMPAEMIAERAVPFVRRLRELKPDTPILLVENIVYQNGWFLEATQAAYTGKNEALKKSFEELKSSGVDQLHYLGCEELLGRDGEATVDGVHPTDLGFLRMAETLEPVIARILEGNNP
jgi:lysophospholipase L1-like esterase